MIIYLNRRVEKLAMVFEWLCIKNNENDRIWLGHLNDFTFDVTGNNNDINQISINNTEYYTDCFCQIYWIYITFLPQRYITFQW